MTTDKRQIKKHPVLILPNLIDSREIMISNLITDTHKRDYVRFLDHINKKFYQEEIKNPVYTSPKVRIPNWKKIRQDEILNTINKEVLPPIGPINLRRNFEALSENISIKTKRKINFNEITGVNPNKNEKSVENNSPQNKRNREPRNFITKCSTLCKDFNIKFEMTPDVKLAQNKW
jgi:hypothetical protein